MAMLYGWGGGGAVWGSGDVAVGTVTESCNSGSGGVYGVYLFLKLPYLQNCSIWY
jgi:hypothetical protein